MSDGLMDFRMQCRCGKQTELYGAFPRCVECQEAICPECMQPDSENEERSLCMCKSCVEEIAEEQAEAELRERDTEPDTLANLGLSESDFL